MGFNQIILTSILIIVMGYGDAEGGKKSFSTCERRLDDHDGCPRTDVYKSFRQQCMNGFQGCPSNTHYVCGVDEATGYIVEICHDIYRCPAGYHVALRFDLNTRNVGLYCKVCDEEHFQSVPSDSSSGYLEGCTQPRYNDAIRNALKSGSLVTHSTGWPSEEDVFRCNSDKGWSNRNGVLDCTTSYLCNCVDDVKCESETNPYLVADGSCIACEEKHKENPKLKCDRKNSTGDDLDISSNSTHLVMDGEEEWTTFKVGLMVGAGVLVVIISVALAICFWVHRRNRLRQKEVPQIYVEIKSETFIGQNIAVGTNATLIHHSVRENERCPSASSSSSATSSPAEEQEHRMEDLKQFNSQIQSALTAQPNPDNKEYFSNHDETKVKQH